MANYRSGSSADARYLSPLIYSSAPVLLPYLFGSETKALDYICKASQAIDGQYSAMRHQVARYDNKVIGCITLWDDNLPLECHAHTMQSVKDFLPPEALMHLVRANAQVSTVFLAPKAHELCLGHLAVAPNYQGRGIGKALISYAISQARIRNKSHIILDVDSNNDEAINVYLGVRFTITSRTVFAPTKQTFYRMTYKLQ